jgi:predicted aconitase with swiveling domain
VSERIIRGHVGIGPKVTGVALSAADYFSARYDLDRIRGVFSRPAHKLCGESYVGRVLVLLGAKGGVATSWMLREMASRQMAPLALLLNTANPIMAQGAAFADIAFMDRFGEDITKAIVTGDEVTVDPAAGEVRVRRAASAKPG